MSKQITLYKSMQDALNAVSPAFCPAKWLQTTVHLATGRTHSCHHPGTHHVPLTELKDRPDALHNTSYKNDVRDQMLQGVKVNECEYCWAIERLNDPNLFSDRVMKSMSLTRDGDFSAILNDPHNIQPKYLEVSFTNACNFSCAYCNPDISSKLMGEVKAHGPINLSMGTMYDLGFLASTNRMPIPLHEHNPYVDAFNAWIPTIIDGLEDLRVTGGEPLLSPATWELLDRIILDPKPNLKLSINTNLGVPTKLITRFIEYVNRIMVGNCVKELIVYTSCESMGADAEYCRFGMNFGEFESNVHRMMSETDVTLVFMTTVNVLSVQSFHTFAEWIMQLRLQYNASNRHNRLPISVNYLRHPVHLCLSHLPASMKSVFTDRLTTLLTDHSCDNRPGSDIDILYPSEVNGITRMIEWMNATPSSLRYQQDFRMFVDELDKRRGLSFNRTFPELTPMYESRT